MVGTVGVPFRFVQQRQDVPRRDPLILLVNLIAALARLMGPGGLRSVVAESLGQAVIAHSQSLA